MRRFLTWRRAGRVALALLVLVVMTPLIYHVVVREMDRRELDAVFAELDSKDPGWRLDDIVNAANAKLPPDDRNPFVLAAAANALLPGDYKERSKDFPKWPVTEPNLLLEVTTQAVLVAALENLRPTITAARGLADLPDEGGNVIVMPANPLFRDTGLESGLVTTQGLLRADALLLANQGHADQAVRSVRAALSTGRAMGENPSNIDQQIRAAAGATAVRAFESVVNLGEPNAGLAELQGEFLRESEAPLFRVGVLAERARFERICDVVNRGAAAVPLPTGAVDYIETKLTAALIYTHLKGDESFGLGLLTQYVETAKLPPHQRLAAIRAIRPVPRTDPRKLLTRIMIPSIESFSERTLRSQGELVAAAVGVACERHRRRFGQWPKTLTDIPRDILSAVPTDPGDGLPIKYKRLADRVVVYSVGPDGIDHGGDLNKATPVNQRDYGIRLYDVSHRRQPAPAGATP